MSEGTKSGTLSGIQVTNVAEEPTQPYRLTEMAEKLARRRRRALRAALSMRRPRQNEVRLSLDRDATLIGRDSICDIVLNEEGVSGRHARIVRTETGYFELVDQSSSNGTWSDGIAVDRMTLQDGDKFSIGETKFTVHIQVVEEEG